MGLTTSVSSEAADRAANSTDAINLTTAFVGVRVIDGTGGPVRDDLTVVVTGGVVSGIGPRTAVGVPPGAIMVVGNGATLLPGIVDSHVHLGFLRHPERLLAQGVTAVRDLGWPPALLAPLRARAEAAGLLVAFTGPMLTAPNGYPMRAAWAPAGTGLEIDTTEDAEAAVDRVVRSGACAVKVAMDPRVGPMLRPGLLHAVVQRALEWGRHVTAHAATIDAVETCLSSGVQELAHLPFGPTPLPRSLADELVARGVRVVPTLGCREGSPTDASAALQSLRTFVDCGGAHLVAYGTDLGNDHTRPGLDLRELLLLHEAGLDPLDVIAAATSRAARLLRAGELTGTIAAGLRADLMLVDGDPATDLGTLAHPRLVVAAGRVT